MKIPGLLPCGDEGATEGWRLAGTDLRRATPVLFTEDDASSSVASGACVVEALRRSGRFTEALELAHRLQYRVDEAGDHYLALFTLATVEWIRADWQRALNHYDEALEHAVNPVERGAALAGKARCLRIPLESDGFAFMEDALGLLTQPSAERADALRERAAWLLMRGDHTAARDAALEAEDQAAPGDLYQHGYAVLLRVRAEWELHRSPKSIGELRDLRLRAADVGAGDLDLAVAPFLAQFLQAGHSGNDPEMIEARAIIDEVLDVAEDPWTEAEVLLPLCHNLMVSGDLDGAEKALDRYAQIYQLLGDNQIAAGNVLNTRARLTLARAGASPDGVLARAAGKANALVVARRQLKAAEKAYREAGFVSAAGRIRLQSEAFRSLAAYPSVLDSSTSVDAHDPRTALLLDALQGLRAEESAPEQAADLLTLALERSRQAGWTPISATIAVHLVSLLSRIGDDRRAQLQELAREAIDLANQVRQPGTVGAYGSPAQLLQDVYGRTALAAARKDLPDEVALAYDAMVGSRLSRLVAGALASDTNLTPATPYGQLEDALANMPPDVAPVEPPAGAHDDVLRAFPAWERGQEYVVLCWHGSDGTRASTAHRLSSETDRWRRLMASPGPRGRARLTIGDLQPVVDLLPMSVVDSLRQRQEVPLTVVATGWLAAIPWAALPLGGGRSDLVLDHADVAHLPAMRLRDVLLDRSHFTGGRRWRTWTAPTIENRPRRPRANRLDSIEDAKAALLQTRDNRLLELIAHGNRAPSLYQSLVPTPDAVDPLISGLDIVRTGTQLPETVSVPCCHSGMATDPNVAEPLGIATALLLGGAHRVFASHFETNVAAPVYNALPDVYEATLDGRDLITAWASWQRTNADRTRPLVDWAVLHVLGARPHRSSLLG